MIATEHVTPVASYQHTLFQLRVLHQALMQDIVRGIERTRELEYKWKDKPKEEPVWWELERGGKKLCWYDTDHLQYEHEMEELKMSVKDKLLQMETFTKVLGRDGREARRRLQAPGARRRGARVLEVAPRAADDRRISR